jgi:cell division septation protein DedD
MLTASEELAGKKGKCPACQKPLTIPEETGLLEASIGLNGVGNDRSTEEQHDETPEREAFNREGGMEGLEGVLGEAFQNEREAKRRLVSPRFVALVGGLAVLVAVGITFTTMRHNDGFSEKSAVFQVVRPLPQKSEDRSVPLEERQPKRETNRVKETKSVQSLLTGDEGRANQRAVETPAVEEEEAAGVKAEAGPEAATLEEKLHSIEGPRTLPGVVEETMAQGPTVEEETGQDVALVVERTEQKVTILDGKLESTERVVPPPPGTGASEVEEKAGQDTLTLGQQGEPESINLEAKPEGIEKPGPLPGRYTVNLASFREKARADSLVRELRGKGLEAFSWEIDLPEKGKWHRVSVGNFATLEYAKNFVIQEGLEENYSVFITRIPRG